jgi:UrcA family protein
MNQERTMNVSNSSIAHSLPLVRRTLTLALSACAALTLCATANAAKPATNTATSIVVKYRDADVRTDQGAASLYRRIASASRAVCPDLDSRNLNEKAAGWACRKQALNNAAAAVNSPQVSALLKNPRLASTR